VPPFPACPTTTILERLDTVQLSPRYRGVRGHYRAATMADSHRQQAVSSE
jgi:hypothetical protein